MGVKVEVMILVDISLPILPVTIRTVIAVLSGKNKENGRSAYLSGYTSFCVSEHSILQFPSLKVGDEQK